MPLRIYSTESGKVETFQPRTPGKVTMYICGPTVYDLIHIGHARSYVVFDVLRRWLELSGYDVVHVQNFTDLEDSITKKAEGLGRPVSEVTERYTREYFLDAEHLNLKKATHYPNVSENVGRMIEVVEGLLDSDLAYERDGNVYLRTGSDDFGSLSHVDLSTTLVDDIQPDDRRENPFDFIIWRRAKKGEPSWSSPWSDGQPGWHTSCFVMSTNHLEEPFDIHGGGLDLIYPHHESVMLISKAHSKKRHCNYYVHNSFVTLGKEKMSKSKGNFVTVRELSEEYGGEAIRLYLLKHHYRTLLDYDEGEIREASEEIQEMGRRLERLRSHTDGSGSETDLSEKIYQERSRFEEAMNDDLGTPKALSILFGLIEWSDSELENLSKDDVVGILDAASQFSEVLGLFQTPVSD